eukprot:TRINITY_DN22445_c0_g1_i1.p1 TRINITY_DN22445_c0_g1~~TRINITY_DN22445_c0_g1_i1.p1  ORF type:complete len:219 (+),score=40.59 TRINITY_DN22445_c0_g1_i1:225-881(+)
MAYFLRIILPLSTLLCNVDAGGLSAIPGSAVSPGFAPPKLSDGFHLDALVEEEDEVISTESAEVVTKEKEATIRKKTLRRGSSRTPRLLKFWYLRQRLKKAILNAPSKAPSTSEESTLRFVLQEFFLQDRTLMLLLDDNLWASIAFLVGYFAVRRLAGSKEDESKQAEPEVAAEPRMTESIPTDEAPVAQKAPWRRMKATSQKDNSPSAGLLSSIVEE